MAGPAGAEVTGVAQLSVAAPAAGASGSAAVAATADTATTGTTRNALSSDRSATTNPPYAGKRKSHPAPDPTEQAGYLPARLTITPPSPGLNRRAMATAWRATAQVIVPLGRRVPAVMPAGPGHWITVASPAGPATAASRRVPVTWC